ncbi:hypothetical protein [Rhodophyticola sp. CCM32]|nr:hypothetical protein [Rhodophyticola sp. CCM32]
MTATRLSYDFLGLHAKMEPMRATPFMAGIGGGWIVTGSVVMNRLRM